MVSLRSRTALQSIGELDSKVCSWFERGSRVEFRLRVAQMHELEVLDQRGGNRFEFEHCESHANAVSGSATEREIRVVGQCSIELIAPATRAERVEVVVEPTVTAKQ